MRYMLDTNICIYVIKHKPEKVFRKLLETDPEDVCISSVTYAELACGVEKSNAVLRSSRCWQSWRSWISMWLRLMSMGRSGQIWKKEEFRSARWI